MFKRRTPTRDLPPLPILPHHQCNQGLEEVSYLGQKLIDPSQDFASWLPGGVVLRGWVRSASGDTAEGISWIGGGIRDYQATGAILRLP